MSLLDRFTAHFGGLALAAKRVLIAVSGGPDSVALLDLMARSREVHGLELIVGHVDHGIQAESGRIAHQVEALARSYGVPVEVGRLGLGSSTGETLARVARYAWLETTRARAGADAIVTAHHADDQAETVLMRVLSGSGPAGLAAMAPVRGRVVRPLLPFQREELARYIEERGLSVWLDPANADPRHLRSWIRTELLPSLRGRLPEVETHLLRVAAQAAANRAAWDALLEVLPGLDLRTEPEAISVAASVLAGYDSNLAQAVLLAAARRIGCRLTPSRITRVFALVERGGSGARVPVGEHWTAELSFGRLRIVSEDFRPHSVPWALEGQRGQGTWGRWRFRWEPATAPERQERVGLRAWFTPDALTVRAWTPGEKVRPLGGAGRRLIVRCFQEVQVPRSRRRAWPVLVQDDHVIWIPGVCRSDARIPAQGSEALRVDAEYA